RAEKIKTLFQSFRIPLWFRRGWPVVVAASTNGGDAIVWSRRFGAAAEFAAGAHSRQVLRIREVQESNRTYSASIQSGSFMSRIETAPPKRRPSEESAPLTASV